MALQGSGAITLQQIENEFGGAGAISLNEYYRNGIYVPSNNNTVPVSGAISMANFYNTQALIVVTVTEGTSTGGQYTSTHRGYVASGKAINSLEASFDGGLAAGSRSPTTVDGITIQGLYEKYYQAKEEYKFVLVLSGTQNRFIFDSIEVQGYGTLTLASAQFETFGGSSIWIWDTGNIGTWDGSGTRTVTFIPTSSVLHNLTYASNGDTNGLIHFLGTQGNTVGFSNPATAGGAGSWGLSYAGSGLPSPQNISDRNTGTSSLPGGLGELFVTYTLPANSFMKLNRLIVRNTGSPVEGAFLQASMDNTNWTTLVNSTATWAGNTWKSFTISDPTYWPYIRYRGGFTNYLRPTAEIELYGTYAK